jgi:hypothetical protein
MTNSDVCPLCEIDVEDVFHVFRDCNVVKKLWQMFIPRIQINLFDDMEWLDWLTINLMNSRLVNGNHWHFIFGPVLDKLWWRRNEVVFKTVLVDNISLF